MELIKYPYGLAADLHLHGWNAFSTTNAGGVSSRLAYLIAELYRLAKEVKTAGGNTMILAGDVFHVRGSVSPSVLNPTLDALRDIVESGIQVIALAGNHDLEGKVATRLGSAITALEGVGVTIVSTAETFNTVNGNSIALFSWVENIDDFKGILSLYSPPNRDKVDLIIHAPIDGVIAGLPPHGLTDEYLATLGLGRVFAGHYHNHKDFGKGIYSIGALAHHTWSDIGSKAGFLLVDSDKVTYRSSHAPKFIQIDETTDMDELPFIADGNYIRAKIGNVSAHEVEQMRSMLASNGAKGSVIHAIKSTVEAREGEPVVAGKAISISGSIADYIKSEKVPHAELVLRKCLSILSEVEEV